MLLQTLFWIAFIVWVVLTVLNTFAPSPSGMQLRTWAERIAAFAAVLFLGLRVFSGVG